MTQSRDRKEQTSISPFTERPAMQGDRTIVAIASPQGGATRGVVRCSGVNAIAIAQQVFFTVNNDFPSPADKTPRIVHGKLQLAHPWPSICAQAWVWPSTRSYTRQPTVEFQLPSSPPLLQALVKRCCELGASVARPGEFTQWAMLAGRLDLAQAEAVLAVINAVNERALRHGLQQLAGGIQAPLLLLRNQLLDDLADLEAGLDFAEEDLSFLDSSALRQRIHSALNEVDSAIQQLKSRDNSSDIPSVLLFGPPNAGKSSLFNALLQCQASITSSQPHTTRDFVAAELTLPNGQKCLLLDSAGVESVLPRLGDAATQRAGPENADDQAQTKSHDALLEQAQQRAKRLLQSAHVVLRCTPLSQHASCQISQELLPLSADAVLLDVVTQCDCQAAANAAVALGHPTSSHTGLGLNALRSHIEAALDRATCASANQAFELAPRTHEVLLQAQSALQHAIQLMQTSQESACDQNELVAAELRSGLEALGELTGAVHTEDLLDRLFSRFCIGK